MFKAALTINCALHEQPLEAGAVKLVSRIPLGEG